MIPARGVAQPSRNANTEVALPAVADAQTGARAVMYIDRLGAYQMHAYDNERDVP